MTSPTPGAPGAPILADYVPVPQASPGPAVNDQGYYVGRVERNLESIRLDLGYRMDVHP
jgi:hypothetical protein